MTANTKLGWAVGVWVVSLLITDLAIVFGNIAVAVVAGMVAFASIFAAYEAINAHKNEVSE